MLVYSGCKKQIVTNIDSFLQIVPLIQWSESHTEKLLEFWADAVQKFANPWAFWTVKEKQKLFFVPDFSSETYSYPHDDRSARKKWDSFWRQKKTAAWNSAGELERNWCVHSSAFPDVFLNSRQITLVWGKTIKRSSMQKCNVNK